MKVHMLEREQFIPQPIDEVFAFFSHAENLEEITPGFLSFRILSVDPPQLRRGTLIRYRLAWHGLFPLRWTTEITHWEPPHFFADSQLSGPYRLWRHEHSFKSRGTGTQMNDIVRYSLPFGPLGVVAHSAVVRRDVESIFDFRAQRIRELFA
jgi:ligand-binding SRPBCC domain-containing protein